MGIHRGNPKRQGNNPRRRIAPLGELTPEVETRLSNVRYVGSAHHKRKPADYGFIPPVNPRPDKSLYDYNRVIRMDEAVELFWSGISRGMVSSHLINGFPKYVWAADSGGEAYEALSKGSGEYHGYQLNASDPMRDWVLEEWKRREQP